VNIYDCKEAPRFFRIHWNKRRVTLPGKEKETFSKKRDNSEGVKNVRNSSYPCRGGEGKIPRWQGAAGRRKRGIAGNFKEEDRRSVYIHFGALYRPKNLEKEKIESLPQKEGKKTSNQRKKHWRQGAR